MANMKNPEIKPAEIEDPPFPSGAAASSQDDSAFYYILVLFLFGVGTHLILERVNWKRFGKV